MPILCSRLRARWLRRIMVSYGLSGPKPSRECSDDGLPHQQVVVKRVVDVCPDFGPVPLVLSLA